MLGSSVSIAATDIGRREGLHLSALEIYSIAMKT